MNMGECKPINKDSERAMKRFDDILEDFQVGMSKLYSFKTRLLPPIPEVKGQPDVCKSCPECFVTSLDHRLERLEDLVRGINETINSLDLFC